jgi:hypothetical protein
VNYDGTAGGGEQHDEYHRPLPLPEPHPREREQERERQVHEGVVLPSATSGGGQWTPPAEHEAATQMLPPYPAFQPPVPAVDPAGSWAPDAPWAPEAPGASEAPAATPGADATQLLPPQDAAPVQDEATTVLRQVPGASPGGAPPDATQPLPRFEGPPSAAPMAQPGYAPAPSAPQGVFDHLYRPDGPPAAAAPQEPMFQGYEYEPKSPPRQGLSRGVLIGIIVVCCAAVGLAAGAVLSGGADSGTAATSSVKTSPAAGGSPSPTPSAKTTNAAEQQAKRLDALLKVSGNSRSSVIRAVADIKACQNLDVAAADLRSAADQRDTLVTRLGRLSIDKLPNHVALSGALNRAWKASAAADDHYANWADQVGGKKGCKGGQARITGQTAQGNAQSGVASLSKKAAVRLWNTIADEYGLTKRTFTQL